MASLSVTNTFVDGQVITASGHNQNFSDVVNYINNRNSGSATWDAVSISTSSGVPLTVDNGAGTSDIANFLDNGVEALSIVDGGSSFFTGTQDSIIIMETSSATGPLLRFTENSSIRWLLGHDGGQVTDGFVLRDSTNSWNPFAVYPSGILQFIKQSGCRAYRTTSTQTVTAGNTDKIQFNAESYDVKAEFDSATNYRFTVTVAGKYLISTHLLATAAGAGGSPTIAIYKNGASYSVASHVNTVGAVGTSLIVTDILDLAASDYIEIFLGAGTQNFTVATGEGNSFVAISKVA